MERMRERGIDKVEKKRVSEREGEVIVFQTLIQSEGEKRRLREARLRMGMIVSWTLIDGVGRQVRERASKRARE